MHLTVATILVAFADVFLIGSMRGAFGGVCTSAIDFEPHLVEDRELTTGQNPRSDHFVGAKLVEALRNARLGA